MPVLVRLDYVARKADVFRTSDACVEPHRLRLHLRVLVPHCASNADPLANVAIAYPGVYSDRLSLLCNPNWRGGYLTVIEYT